MERLEGRVAIVTGGGNGLGRAIAELFSLEGASVVVADIDEKAANETAALIRDKGGEALAVKTDVSLAPEVDRLMSATATKYGRIDILVNNAGVRGMGGVLDLTEDDWDRILSVNLKGMFLCSKFALPHMLRQGKGNIVCISSISGVVGHRGQAAYNASKHGIIGLARCMAIDHADNGIRVNVVCPGMMLTPMLAHESEENLREYAKMNLFKRPGEASEVANAVLHLASDESSFTTGSVYMADAGSTAV
jgi:NAD(P)-dependent dehydrogenase (short-subunit alcohol dehydrogenase family)